MFQAEAVHMLTQAFAEELLGELENEQLRSVMAEHVSTRLHRMREDSP